MSAKRKVNMPLTQNGVITEEAMLAYLNGMLTPEDTAKFEQLVAEDPFAREALDGLQSTVIPKLKDTFDDISNKVAERSGAAQPSNSISLTAITRYAVAAVLIGLLVGMAFLITNYINKQSPQLAMETGEGEKTSTEAKPFMEQEVAAESLSAESSTLETDTAFVTVNDANTYAWGDSSTSVITISDNNTNTQNSYSTTKQTTEPATKTNAVKQEVATADKKAEEKRKADMAAKKQMAVNSTLTASGNATAGAAAPTATPARTEALKQEEQTINAKATDAIAEDGDTEMEVAMESFNNRNYKNATKMFGKVLDKNPNNTDAIYFNSVSEFINGNNNKALKGFEKLLDKNDKHVDGSMYYKAQILLKKGKQEEARYLFDQVSKGNSSFKQRAAEKLEEIR